MDLKHTPLYKNHLKLGGQMVDFAGWSLPIQYTSILKEHEAVRKEVGFFDTSHMGEIFVRGTDTTTFIDYLITNDFKNLDDNRCVYSPMCHEKATVIDDVIVCKFNSTKAMVVVNACNIQKDFNWMQKIASSKNYHVLLDDCSEEYAMLAVQGPKALDIIKKIIPQIDTLKSFSFLEFFISKKELKKLIKDFSLEINTGLSGIFSMTGYTGEKGGEFYIANTQAPVLMDVLFQMGVTPCGLGARDSLRLEKGYSLYGHELTDNFNVLEAGLGWAVKMQKECFIGKSTLEQYQIKKKLIGFIMQDRLVARQGAVIWSNNDPQNNSVQDVFPIGIVTSGTYSPTIKKNIGLAFVPIDYENDYIYVDIRGKKFRAQVTNRTFVQ